MYVHIMLNTIVIMIRISFTLEKIRLKHIGGIINIKNEKRKVKGIWQRTANSIS
jgi:hypothetical protein